MMNWRTFFCLLAVLLISTRASAGDKVVVIPMSSSSVSKQQTYMYDRDALKITGASPDSYINYIGGCANNSVAGLSSFVPLALPVGARIVSIYVNIYDGSSTAEYDIRLSRHYISEGVFWGDTVISTYGGSGTTPQVVKRLLTPKTTEIVEENESFSLEFTTDSATANGFCSAQITLELP